MQSLQIILTRILLQIIHLWSPRDKPDQSIFLTLFVLDLHVRIIAPHGGQVSRSNKREPSSNDTNHEPSLTSSRLAAPFLVDAGTAARSTRREYKQHKWQKASFFFAEARFVSVVCNDIDRSIELRQFTSSCWSKKISR